MRNQVKSYLICSIIIAFCSVVLSYGASSKPETANQPSNSSPANEDVISLYKELIALRQHAIDNKKHLLEIGQTSPSDLIEPELELAEARIDLAEFQGEKKIVIEELQKMEQSLQEIRTQQKKEVDSGQRPIDGLNDIDSRILETKIRLAKMKLENLEASNSFKNEYRLNLRLDLASKITDIKMKNDTLSSIAAIAARAGNIEIVKNILGQINEIQLKNQTARTCAVELVQANKTQDALEIIYALINDLKLRNEILMHIATMDYEWTY